MIVQVEKSATDKEKADVLDKAIASLVEIDCKTEDVYVKESVADYFITLIGNKKVKFVGGKFPKRYVEDEKGDILDKNNKAYRKMTVEDCGKAPLNTVPDMEITKKFLESMLLAPLKEWVKARPALDKVVDLRLKKDLIIEAILKHYGV